MFKRMRECSVTRELEAHSQWDQKLVCAWKKETRVKKTRMKSEKHEKKSRNKTNKDEKRDWHANTQQSMPSSQLNTQTHKVEVLGTLHSQRLFVFWPISSQQQEPSENTMQTHTVAFWLLGCEKE